MQDNHTAATHGLWRDQRPFTSRLLLALPVALGWGVTFFLFGILDLYLHNKGVLTFLFADIALPTLLLGLVVAAGMFAVLALLKGRVLDAAISLLWGILVAGYVQGTFLNLPLGELDGVAIVWDAYRTHAVVNLLIWGAIIGLPFVLHALCPKPWKMLMVIVPWVLIGMQTAGLVSTLATARGLFAPRDRYLSEAGVYELSDSDNILVLVVDRLDGRFIDKIMGMKEDFFDPLDGFTYYRDTTSLYSQTYPAVPYMLTGEKCTFDTPADDFCDMAYAKSRFLPTLRALGYTTKLYIQLQYAYTRIQQIEPLADNILDGKIEADVPAILSQMSLLSGFRYVPHALKASFFMSTAALEGLMALPEGLAPYQLDDYRLYQGLVNNGLTTQSDKKNFTFLHLKGSHYPFVLNEKIEQIPWEQGGEIPQTMGCFEIIYEYLNRMRELGLYEQATILILGDHGGTNRGEELSDYTTAALFYKPGGRADVPLDYSDAQISHTEFQATILKAAGADYADYGRAIDDIPEDEDRVREFYHRIEGGDPVPDYQEHYEIDSYAENFDNWYKLEDIPIKYLHGT